MKELNRLTLIQMRLEEAFSPTYLEVRDESQQHKGHAGYQGGGRHFAILISANAFISLPRLAAHRKIYALFADMMPDSIHALRIIIKNN